MNTLLGQSLSPAVLKVLGAKLLTVVLAIAVGVLAYKIAASVINRLLRPLTGARDYDERLQRALTLGPLMRSVARYLIGFFVLVVILDALGIEVRALIVSAGVVGLALGLGAQSLIKDILMGFFLLFEGLIAVGDVVEVGPHVGVVESVGIRVTKIRKFSGEQRIIPNGELTQFGNYNRGFGRAIVEVGVTYDTDIPRALEVLEEVGRRWAADHPRLALEPPVAQGIIRFGESEVVLRLHVKVDSASRVDVEYELRRLVKEALDRAGIRIPYPQRVVHLRADQAAGSEPHDH